MINKIKYLNRINKIIDFNDFYVITIWNDYIQFQGHYKCDILSKYIKLGLFTDPIINSEGHINLYRKSKIGIKINITLT